MNLPAPKFCDACCSLNIKLTTNDVLNGRKVGEWPFIYYCEDCNAAVGCHHLTYIPLGRMAGKEIRSLRSKAHKAFDPIWENKYMNRTRAYQWLAVELNIDFEECHIGWMTKDQLLRAIVICKSYVNDNEKVLERRRKKQNEKELKQVKRISSKMRQRKASKKFKRPRNR